MTEQQTNRWYKDGLSFQCTQCGDCCSGDPGYVWVDPDEIQAMADKMQMTRDEFSAKFIRKVGKQFSLMEYDNGDCILLDPVKRTCLVYQARPIQCRTWPFWDSNLQNKKAWKATCNVCPGSGTGKLYSFDEIEVQRKRKSV